MFVRSTEQAMIYTVLWYVAMFTGPRGYQQKLYIYTFWIDCGGYANIWVMDVEFDTINVSKYYIKQWIFLAL